MATQAKIDGVPVTLEKLADGRIRVTHESVAFNPLHGQATDGEMTYIVHPIQRNQYEHLHALLSPADRAAGSATGERLWWSYVPSAKEAP